MRMVLKGENLDNVTLSSLAPISTKSVEKLKTKLTIGNKRDYPITTGFPAQLQQLTIVTCNLKKIEGRILALRNLVRLDMSQNCIRQLPTDFAHLTALSELILHNNLIEDIPKEFCCGPLSRTLSTLDLSNNKVRIVRSHIAKLRNLVSLNLERNQITALPMSLKELTQLRNLFVSDNELRTLPAGFANLRLDALNLFGNHFLLQTGAESAKDKLHLPTLLETTARAIKRMK